MDLLKLFIKFYDSRKKLFCFFVLKKSEYIRVDIKERVIKRHISMI